jgi:hypothetical protein
MASAMSRLWVKEFLINDQGISLTEEQQARLAEPIARRMMRLGHTHGNEVARFAEYCMESMLHGNGRISPEGSQEFGRRIQPMIPIMRELFDGLPEESQSVLNDEQLRKVDEWGEMVRSHIDRFASRMDEWAAGKKPEKKHNPFDDLEGRQEDKDAKTPEARQREYAERNARWQVNQLGPEEWKQFLDRAARYLHFDDEQKARGQALLKDYAARADEIRTPEWKERIHRNRTKAYFQWRIREDHSGAPWRYHLDCEYEELAAPLKGLGQRFHREVMALASAEQREAIVTETNEFGLDLGMTDEELAPIATMLFPPPSAGQ